MANSYGWKATFNLLTINIQRTFGKKLDPSRTLNSFCEDGGLQSTVPKKMATGTFTHSS